MRINANICSERGSLKGVTREFGCMGSRPRSNNCLLKIIVVDRNILLRNYLHFYFDLFRQLNIDAILNIINFSSYQLPSISIEAKIPLSDGLVSQRKYKLNIKSS